MTGALSQQMAEPHAKLSAANEVHHSPRKCANDVNTWHGCKLTQNVPRLRCTEVWLMMEAEENSWKKQLEHFAWSTKLKSELCRPLRLTTVSYEEITNLGRTKSIPSRPFQCSGKTKAGAWFEGGVHFISGTLAPSHVCVLYMYKGISEVARGISEVLSKRKRNIWSVFETKEYLKCFRNESKIAFVFETKRF